MSTSQRLYPGLNLEGTDPASHEAAEEVVFGFWIFLMSDLVLFAVLFATYATMSVDGVAAGPAPVEVFDLGAAFAETLLLLFSSFAFGFAMLAVKYRARHTGVLAWLLVTGLLGVAFVGMELHDYYVMVTVHGAPPQASGFLSAYYLLTGTHALHVSAGLVWMAVLAVQIVALGMTGEVKLRLMRLALFWHMLDVVWIGIFTFVYLYGAVA